MAALRNLVVVADVGGGPFHVGDEAMLAANLAVLCRHDPALRFTVVGREAAWEIDRPAGERLASAVSDAFAAADGLFISGGGNLSSSWPELLSQRILLMREARRRGLPVVTGGQTIGPELAAKERAALAEALAGAQLVGVRELPSLALALELGVPEERLSYQPDDAFFLAGQAPVAGRLAAPIREPFLAVTLDTSFAAPGARTGLSSLAAQLATFARDHGLHLAFLPHFGRLGSVDDEDGRTGVELRLRLQALGQECMLFPVLSPAEAVWLTQRASLVVSSRYHPLVFATAGAVPCLGIFRDAYTRIKLQGALVHAGLGRWSLSAESAEEGGLGARLRELWSEGEQARKRMVEARARLEAQESGRWRRVLARLGWPMEASAAPEPSPLGCPANRLAAAALSVLALERQAADTESARWRALVSRIERAVDLVPRVEPRTPRTTEERIMLTETQWNDYLRDGFLYVGQVVEEEELESVKRRADDLALGRVKNPRILMQMDTGGRYEDLPAAVPALAEGGTVLYRKLQGLESDDLFSPLVRHPLFLEACARLYGPHAPISIFRAMVMNKPAGQGTLLPWHQDGGDVWALDRDPLLTVWVALDPATRANGCVEVVPGTHRLGLLSSFGSTIEQEQADRHCPEERVVPLELEPGHAVLLHNWLIHRSGVNPSSVPRRAFTACYMDGRTQSILTGNRFPLVAGELSDEPYPFIRQLREDCAILRKSLGETEEYARSLEAERATLREMREEAERYAKSLESERQRLEVQATSAAAAPRGRASAWRTVSRLLERR